MVIPWATNLLHFHLNKLFKKWFVFSNYVACIMTTFMVKSNVMGPNVKEQD